jgi:hypothetical protein
MWKHKLFRSQMVASAGDGKAVKFFDELILHEELVYKLSYPRPRFVLRVIIQCSFT